MRKKIFAIISLITVFLIIIVFLYFSRLEQARVNLLFFGENGDWNVEYTASADENSKYINESITIQYTGDPGSWDQINYMEVYLNRPNGSVYSEKGYLADYEKKSAEIRYDFSSIPNTDFNLLYLEKAEDLTINIITIVENSNIRLDKKRI